MKKTHAFYPDVPEPLEARLVPSRVGLLPSAQVAPRSGIVQPTHPQPSAEAARFEVAWMRGMIDHHGMAIRMARLALRNSADPGVLDLARGIVRAQAREVSQLQSWLASGYGVRGVRPRMAPEDTAMLSDLAAARGSVFDAMFLRQMIEHHGAAVRDADELLGRAFHARLRRLGADIIAAQTAEIRQMQAMLGRVGGMAGDGSSTQSTSG